MSTDLPSPAELVEADTCYGCGALVPVGTGLCDDCLDVLADTEDDDDDG